MKLGDAGRRLVKGHELSFYVETLHEVRERTLAELRKRNDDWLMAIDEDWGWDRPTTSASGSMSASMSPIILDRLTFT